ncbi:MAG: phosphate ABC transporter substrate-binding protein [Polyangiales bacterium]
MNHTTRSRWRVVMTCAATLCAILASDDGLASINAQSSENSLELRGAGVMLPIMQRVAEAYMTDHPESIIALSGGNGPHGLKAVIVGVAEVAMASNELTEELETAARDRGVKLARVDVFRDAVVPIVDPSNPVNNVTLAQLHDIFRGTIKNWAELGGDDAPIEILTHQPWTGVYETFREKVMGGDAVISPTATVVPYADYKKALSPHAIGYVGFRDTADVKPLGVQGVKATLVTIGDETYPITRTSSLWIRQPAPAVADKLVDYLLSDKGQAIIRDQGDFPCTRRVP